MQGEKNTSVRHTIRGTSETESQPGLRTTLKCIPLMMQFGSQNQH